MLLRLLEMFFVILYTAFIITEVVIPLTKSVPLFPSFRKQADNEQTKTTKTKKGE